jgi:hypothetical protein
MVTGMVLDGRPDVLVKTPAGPEMFLRRRPASHFL